MLDWDRFVDELAKLEEIYEKVTGKMEITDKTADGHEIKCGMEVWLKPWGTEKPTFGKIVKKVSVTSVSSYWILDTDTSPFRNFGHASEDLFLSHKEMLKSLKVQLEAGVLTCKSDLEKYTKALEAV